MRRCGEGCKYQQKNNEPRGRQSGKARERQNKTINKKNHKKKRERRNTEATTLASSGTGSVRGRGISFALCLPPSDGASRRKQEMKCRTKRCVCVGCCVGMASPPPSLRLSPVCPVPRVLSEGWDGGAGGAGRWCVCVCVRSRGVCGEQRGGEQRAALWFPFPSPLHNACGPNVAVCLLTPLHFKSARAATYACSGNGAQRGGKALSKLCIAPVDFAARHLGQSSSDFGSVFAPIFQRRHWPIVDVNLPPDCTTVFAPK